MTKQRAGLASRVPCAHVSTSCHNCDGAYSSSQREAGSRSVSRGRIIAALAAFMLAGAIGASAQVTLAPIWNQLLPQNSQLERSTQAMAYDAAHGQVVMFGGFGPGGQNGYLNDTWLWNGTTWTQVFPANSPSPRSNAQMVYDPATGNVVLFGGLYNGSTRYADTWTWDGTNWTPLTTAHSPTGGRASASMVYDAATGNVVLFGGINTSGGTVGDTWIFNGTDWTPASPTNSPSARNSYAMAYDAALGEVILFGGLDQNDDDNNDTWAWNGSSWTPLSPSGAPPARDGAGMDYDPLPGQMVLFGGDTTDCSVNPCSETYFNDTWVLTGTSNSNLVWTQQTTPSGLANRGYMGMVYDAAEGQVVLFGGATNVSPYTFGDTWTWGTPQYFGDINVCPSGQNTPAPCSNTLTLTYNVPASGIFAATPTVVTQGASGLDFQDAGGDTCTGSVSGPTTCTVNVTFAPIAPGARTGAVQLYDTSIPANLLASTLIYGVGQAPAAALSPVPGNDISSPVVGLDSPEGVAVDAAGNVYIANTGDGNVLKVAPGGGQTTIAAPNTGAGNPYVNFPETVAVDGAGDVFIGQFGPSVAEVPAGCTNSACQIFWGALSAATSVALDAAGDVFVGDQGQSEVVELPANGGQQIILYKPQNGFTPGGMAVDLAGDVFVTDITNNKVLEIPAGGGAAVQVGSGWVSPQSVALDAAGDLYVADTGLNSYAGGIAEIPAGCTQASCQMVMVSGITVYGFALDPTGDIYLADYHGGYLDEAAQQGISLGFPGLQVGTACCGTPFALQNIGNQTLTAVDPVLLVNPNWSAFGSCTSSFSLVPGADCSLSIGFAPLVVSQSGTLYGNAEFVDNALNSPAAYQSISLSGTSSVPMNPNFTILYTLTVTTAGTGGGVVTDNFNAISCNYSSPNTSGMCSANYENNALVTLSAGLVPGSTFVGWGGACASSGTNPNCVVTMSQAQNVSATFANGSFAVANVGSSSTITATINFASLPNVGEAKALTEGVQTQEFQATGSNCTGAVGQPGSCTVTVTFRPQAPGLRLGAVQLLDGTGTTVYATQAIYGIGQAPEAAFGPAVTFTPPLTSQTVLNFSSQVTQLTLANEGVGMTTDYAGNLYLAAGTVVEEAAPPYTAVSTTLSGFTNAEGVAIDGAGNLYVADESASNSLGGHGEVLQLSPSCVSSIASGSTPSSCGVAVYQVAGPHPGPVSVAVDGQGDLFIADNPLGVFEIPANGSGQLTLYNAGGSSAPSGVAADAAGDVFVADSGLGQVVELLAGCSAVGCPSTTVGSGWGTPYGVSVDAAGDVYVADFTLTIDGQADAGGLEEVPAGCTTSSCQILLFTAGAPDPASVAVSGTGQIFVSTDGPLFEINQSQPPSLTFVSTPDGSQSADSPQAVTIQNIGNQSLTGSVGSVATTNFAEDNSTCNNNFFLNAGATCTENFDFTPQTTGTLDDYALVADNSGGTSATQQINLAGTGTSSGGGGNYTLTITGAGLGSGEVYSTDDNISCTITNGEASGNCSYAYPSGSSILLEETLNGSTSTFAGWGGACAGAGSNSQCGLTINGNASVTASFMPPNYGAANVCPGGQGTAPCSTSIPVTFNFNNNLVMVASYRVVTQGYTTLDFQAAGNQASNVCSNQIYNGGDSCTVNVTFTPQAVGLRTGSVQLLDKNGNVLLYQFISGIGQGAVAAFNPLPTFGRYLGGPNGDAANSVPLNLPQGVAVDANGNVYIADTGNSQILELTGNNTNPVTSGGFTSPEGMALDGSGNLYVADPNYYGGAAGYGGEVVEVTPGCTISGCLVGVYNNYSNYNETPTGVAVDVMGDLFIADPNYYGYGFSGPCNSGAVVELLANGYTQNVVYSSECGAPTGVAVDAAGDVFVADPVSSSVYELPASNMNNPIPIGASWSQPESVAVDAAGDVYVTDIGQNGVIEVPPGCTSTQCEITVAGNAQSYGVAVDSLGGVYYLDYASNGGLEWVTQQFYGLSFPQTRDNSASQKYVNLQNVGNQALTVTALTISDPNDFFQPDLGTGGGLPPECLSNTSLPAGNACNLAINFVPQDPGGQISGTVSLTDNGLNNSTPTQVFYLSGTGIPGSGSNFLTVTESGSGSGSVTSNDTLINCTLAGGSTTGACISAPSNGSVILTATPAANSTFTGWGGACSGTTPTCTVTMNQAQNVSASFAQGNLGTVNVCTDGSPSGCTGTSQTVTFNFTSSVSVGSVNVVTQGVTGLDFQEQSDGDNCSGNTFNSGQSCTVTVNFTPTAPGLRTGAVQLLNGSNVVATQLLSGIGQGPAISLNPATQVTFNTQGTFLSNPGGVAVDAAGDVFISDNGHSQIVEVATGGNVTTISGGFTGPQGIALDGAGNLFVPVSSTDQVLEFPAGCTNNLCGNGTQNGNEACDGADLGGQIGRAHV